MSRTPGTTFAAFFPSAPRAAKDKAKEREKAKSKTLESPSIIPIADHDPNVPAKSGGWDTGHVRPAGETNIAIADTAPLAADDNESLQGDLLNGVGSASSHTSTVSSVFSTTAQQSTMSTSLSRNLSNLTPLTNTDSSPNRLASPHHSKLSATAIVSSEYVTDIVFTDNEVLPAQSATPDQNIAEPRVHARDPEKGVKGMKCIYDPQLDRKLSSNDKKRAKPTYTEFGLVRIHAVGSVILFVRMSG